MRGRTAAVVSVCFECYPRLISSSPIGYPAPPMGSARCSNCHHFTGLHVSGAWVLIRTLFSLGLILFSW